MIVGLSCSCWLFRRQGEPILIRIGALERALPSSRGNTSTSSSVAPAASASLGASTSQQAGTEMAAISRPSVLRQCSPEVALASAEPAREGPPSLRARRTPAQMAEDLRRDLGLTGDDTSVAFQALETLGMAGGAHDTTETMLAKCHARMFGEPIVPNARGTESIGAAPAASSAPMPAAATAAPAAGGGRSRSAHPVASAPTAELHAPPASSGEWWAGGTPSCKHPIAQYARPLHLALYPLSILLASIEAWTEALEAVLGDEGYTSHAPRTRPLLMNPRAILIAPIMHLVLATLGLFNDVLQLIFGTYESKQSDADDLDSEGGARGVHHPSQLAIAFLARFGPYAALVGMLLLGGVPSGATEKKSRTDPWFRQISLGSGSALARAYVRGEARTVAFLLHAAPAIKVDGSFFSTQVLPGPSAANYKRHVEQWVGLERDRYLSGAAHVGWTTGTRTARSRMAAALGTLIDVVLIAVIMIASWRHPCEICGGMEVRGMSVTAGHNCVEEIDGVWQIVGTTQVPWSDDGFGFTDEARCVSSDPRFEMRLNSDDAVEIYHAGSWKYVCDDSWGINDANVVCRQLGLGSAVSAPREIQIPTSSFWLDDLRCEGDEAHLGDCPHRGWGSHNCGTSEGAGARCNGTYIESPPPPPPPPPVGNSTARRLQATRRWESFTCQNIADHYAAMAHPDWIGSGTTTCGAVQSFYSSRCCTSAGS